MSIEQKTEATSDVLDLSQVDTFISRIFDRDLNARPTDVKAPQADVRAPAVDTDAVEDLIAKALRAIEVLSSRCEILEQQLSEAADRASEQNGALERWKSLATEFQTQAANGRKLIGDLTARAEAAEARVTVLEAAEAEARGRVDLADAVSDKLRGRVIAAFGQQSRVHSVIEATTLPQAAE